MAAKNTFEKSLLRLEEVVNKLESGELSLEDSMKLYEEGTALVADCTNKLNKAEQKVQILRKNMEGEPVLESFEGENA